MTGDPNRGDRTRLSDREDRTRRDDTHEDRKRRERLERAEKRRQERRARAAAAERTEGVGTTGENDRSSNSHLLTVSMRLRDAAFVLLPIGFIGLTVSEAWLEPTDSPFAAVFAVGIGCALASIYLGIYQHDPTD